MTDLMTAVAAAPQGTVQGPATAKAPGNFGVLIDCLLGSGSAACSAAAPAGQAAGGPALIGMLMDGGLSGAAVPEDAQSAVTEGAETPAPEVPAAQGEQLSTGLEMQTQALAEAIAALFTKASAPAAASPAVPAEGEKSGEREEPAGEVSGQEAGPVPAVIPAGIFAVPAFMTGQFADGGAAVKTPEAAPRPAALPEQVSSPAVTRSEVQPQEMPQAAPDEMPAPAAETAAAGSGDKDLPSGKKDDAGEKAEVGIDAEPRPDTVSGTAPAADRAQRRQPAAAQSQAGTTAPASEKAQAQKKAGDARPDQPAARETGHNRGEAVSAAVKAVRTEDLFEQGVPAPQAAAARQAQYSVPAGEASPVQAAPRAMSAAGVDAVVQAAEKSSLSGSSVSLEIKEDSLGTIKVEVTASNGEISVRLETDNPDSGRFLKERSQELEQALARKGFSGGVEVFSGEGKDPGHGRQGRAPRRYAAAPEAEGVSGARAEEDRLLSMYA